MTSGATLDTSTPGTRVFTVNATDVAGNTATRTYYYTVRYAFDGFLAPIHNVPVANRGPARAYVSPEVEPARRERRVCQ